VRYLLLECYCTGGDGCCVHFRSHFSLMTAGWYCFEAILYHLFPNGWTPKMEMLARLLVHACSTCERCVIFTIAEGSQRTPDVLLYVIDLTMQSLSQSAHRRTVVNRDIFWKTLRKITNTSVRVAAVEVRTAFILHQIQEMHRLIGLVR